MSNNADVPNAEFVANLREVSLTVEILPNRPGNALGEPGTSEASATSDSIEGFLEIAQRFTTVLQLLWTYAHGVGFVAERTSLTNLASIVVLLKILQERESKALPNERPLAEVTFSLIMASKTSEDKEIARTQKVYEADHLRRIADCVRYHDAALQILNDTVLQQIVNAWESCLGSLVNWHLGNSPESIGHTESISYAQILKFESFEEVKRFVLDQQVDEFLKRKDTIEQLNYLKDKMSADLSTHFDKKLELAEAVLRRHAVVHAEGRASAEYLRRAKKLGGRFVENISRGDSISPKAKYIRGAWSIFYAGGVILLHLVCKAHARQVKNDEEEKRADGFLIDASFTCIKERQYDAAESILRYACNHHLKSEQSRLIAKVNYAQTLKWMGKVDEANAVLDAHDWSTCNLLYQICVAAIRGDVETFSKLLPRVAADGDLRINEVYDWPAFKLMRENDGFSSWVERAFGTTLPKELKEFEPKLLHTGHEQTLGVLKSLMGAEISAPKSQLGGPPDATMLDEVSGGLTGGAG